MEEDKNPWEIDEVENLASEVEYTWENYKKDVKWQAEKTQGDFEKDIVALRSDIAALIETMRAIPSIGMEMTKRGLSLAKNGIDQKAQATKKTFFTAIKTVRDKVTQTRDNVATGVRNTATQTRDSISTGVRNYKQNVRTGMKEVDQATLDEEMFTARTAMEANSEDRAWSEARKQEGRNAKVTDVVQAAKEASRQRRANISSLKVRVTGVVGKGLVLVGQKGLAKEMIERVGQENQMYVAEESRTGKLLQRVAQFGFRIVDKARDTRDDVVHSVEVGKAYVMAGTDAVKDGVVKGATAVRDGAVTSARAVKDTAKDVAETVAIGAMLGADKVKTTAIKGAISLGKGTYKTVGTAVGIINFAKLQALSLGKTIGKASRQFVKDNIADPVREVKDDVKDFAEVAKSRVEQVKNIPTNLRGRAAQLLRATADKVAPTLDETRTAEARSKEAEEKRKAFIAKKGKDEGMELT